MFLEFFSHVITCIVFLLYYYSSLVVESNLDYSSNSMVTLRASTTSVLVYSSYFVVSKFDHRFN